MTAIVLSRFLHPTSAVSGRDASPQGNIGAPGVVSSPSLGSSPPPFREAAASTDLALRRHGAANRSERSGETFGIVALARPGPRRADRQTVHLARLWMPSPWK